MPKTAKLLLVLCVCGLTGGLLGAASPWKIDDPLYWIITAPIAFVMGLTLSHITKEWVHK